MSRHPKTRQPQPAAASGRKKRDESHSSVYLQWPVYWTLHDIAAERAKATGKRVKMHDLLMEGVEAVLKRHGKPSIAVLTKRGSER